MSHSYQFFVVVLGNKLNVMPKKYFNHFTPNLCIKVKFFVEVYCFTFQKWFPAACSFQRKLFKTIPTSGAFLCCVIFLINLVFQISLIGCFCIFLWAGFAPFCWVVFHLSMGWFYAFFAGWFCVFLWAGFVSFCGRFLHLSIGCIRKNHSNSSINRELER